MSYATTLRAKGWLVDDHGPWRLLETACRACQGRVVVALPRGGQTPTCPSCGGELREEQA